MHHYAELLLQAGFRWGAQFCAPIDLLTLQDAMAWAVAKNARKRMQEQEHELQVRTMIADSTRVGVP